MFQLELPIQLAMASSDLKIIGLVGLPEWPTLLFPYFCRSGCESTG